MMMSFYQKFSVSDSDRFSPAAFPGVDSDIRRVVAELALLPAEKCEMVLSFAKHHRIASNLVHSHPALAALIATNTLRLQGIEALFEASKSNLPFSTELEDHIRKSFEVHHGEKSSAEVA